MKQRLNLLPPLLLLLSVLFADGLSAQQVPYSSFYRANWQMVNPAAIDRSHYLNPRLHNTLVFNGGYRQQWFGVEGAPRTFFASVEWCPEQDNKYQPGMKLGGTLLRDQTDALSTTSIMANYSYYFLLPGNGGHILHLGLSGRVNQHHIDVEALRYKDPGDNVINAVTAQPNYLFADVALGVLYRAGRDFYLGASVPSAFALNITSQADGLNMAKETRRHFFVMTGGFIPFGPSSNINREYALFMLEPSFWMRIVPGIQYNSLFAGQPVSFDGNLRVHWYGQFLAGIGYGSNQTAQVEVGYTMRWSDLGTRLSMGLAYSFPAGNKYLALGHSVELTVSYWGL